MHLKFLNATAGRGQGGGSSFAPLGLPHQLRTPNLNTNHQDSTNSYACIATLPSHLHFVPACVSIHYREISTGSKQGYRTLSGNMLQCINHRGHITVKTYGHHGRQQVTAPASAPARENTNLHLTFYLHLHLDSLLADVVVLQFE